MESTKMEAGDRDQRRRYGEMDAEAFEHELRTHEDQDRREAVVQVDETVYEAFQGARSPRMAKVIAE